jgi:hypothetical protein
MLKEIIMADDRLHLVEMQQPFGQVSEARVFGVHPSDGGLERKGLGMDKVVLNHGATHGPSLADPNPGALRQAMAHHSDPFYWAKK